MKMYPEDVELAGFGAEFVHEVLEGFVDGAVDEISVVVGVHACEVILMFRFEYIMPS